MKTLNATAENWSGARRSAMARIRMSLEAARKVLPEKGGRRS